MRLYDGISRKPQIFKTMRDLEADIARTRHEYSQTVRRPNRLDTQTESVQQLRYRISQQVQVTRPEPSLGKELVNDKKEDNHRKENL